MYKCLIFFIMSAKIKMTTTIKFFTKDETLNELDVDNARFV